MTAETLGYFVAFFASFVLFLSGALSLAFRHEDAVTEKLRDTWQAWWRVQRTDWHEAGWVVCGELAHAGFLGMSAWRRRTEVALLRVRWTGWFVRLQLARRFPPKREEMVERVERRYWSVEEP